MNKKLIISKKYKYIYFEIPKAASRSILTALSNTDYKYITWDKYQTEWDGYFKFTFFRDPIDRIVSCYNFFFNNMSKGNKIYLKPYGLSPGMTFNQFLFGICNIEIEKNKHWCPQVDLVPEELFKHNRNCKIAQIERGFQYTFDNICNRLGIEPLYLKHQNKSNKKFTRDMIDPIVMELIKTIYKEDFKLFDYEKDN